MICEIIPSHTNVKTKTTTTVLVPQYPHTGNDLYDMLNAAFPYTQETCEHTFWQFFLICYGGYDNAVEFLF